VSETLTVLADSVMRRALTDHDELKICAILRALATEIQPLARELAGRLIDGEVQPGETMRIVALLGRVAALGGEK